MNHIPNLLSLDGNHLVAGLPVPSFEPLPILIEVHGRINGTDIEMNGVGYIPKVGVYKCNLGFDVLPPDFHPAAIATYTVSICCVATAVERNGGQNFRNTGAAGYRTKRVLTFPTGRITIEGDVSLGKRPIFKGTINGDARLEEEPSGNSIYIKRLDPVDGHIAFGVGEGSIHTVGGGSIPVKIETLHTLRPSVLANPLTRTQFRVVTESGELCGRTYTTEVHSILDAANTMSNVMKMQCSLANPG